MVLDTPHELLPTHESIKIGSTEGEKINGNAFDVSLPMFEAIVQSAKMEESAGVSQLHSLTTQTLGNQAKGIFKEIPDLREEHLSGATPSRNTFDVHVDYTAQPTSSGYLFRVTLYPKQGIHFKRIVQNYLFLIDRSHSIRSQRYELTKAAVSQALAHLYGDDTFNILVFDDRVVSFSATAVKATPENISKAQQFIKGQPYGGFFASTDLLSSLTRAVPRKVPEKEVNTAILLSDGDSTLLSKEKQLATIMGWTGQNKGKVSLFCVPSGKGNNLKLLNMLSNFNKGSMIHAKNDKDIGTTLSSLIGLIRHPIGKNLKTATVAENKTTNINLFPANHRMPNLYENIPYTIYGTIDRLENFHLFLQGHYYDELLDIKINVDFAKARPAQNKSLEDEIALQQSYAGYEKNMKTSAK
jgi:hypothetical protein